MEMGCRVAEAPSRWNTRVRESILDIGLSEQTAQLVNGEYFVYL